MTALRRFVELRHRKGVIDPTEIARKFDVTLLTEEERVSAVAYLVRTMYRGQRASILHTDPEGQEANGDDSTLGSAASQQSHSRSRLVPLGHSYLDDKYCIRGAWKLAGDMTVTDCLWLASDYDERAGRNAALAELWRARANKLAATDLKTLRDLELEVAA